MRSIVGVATAHCGFPDWVSVSVGCACAHAGLHARRFFRFWRFCFAALCFVRIGATGIAEAEAKAKAQQKKNGAFWLLAHQSNRNILELPL